MSNRWSNDYNIMVCISKVCTAVIQDNLAKLNAFQGHRIYYAFFQNLNCKKQCIGILVILTGS